MDPTLIGALAALALLDSTSIGTLVIPVWMLIRPGRPPIGRIVRYLATLAAFYLAVGAVLLVAVTAGVDVGSRWIATPVVAWGQLLLGVGLFALSFRYDSAKQRARGETGRVDAWRARVLGSDGSGSVTTLAVSAGAAELVTMLPYLGAIAVIARADVTTPLSGILLIGYCAVMVVPALVILGGRVAAGTRADGVLGKLDAVLARYADSAVGYAVGIAGFFLGANAAQTLFT